MENDNGLQRSVKKVVLAMVEEMPFPQRAKRNTIIVLDRMEASMPAVFSFVLAHPESHVLALIEFIDAIDKLGDESKPVGDSDINRWMKENHFWGLHEQYRVCIRTFIQRGLKYHEHHLELIDQTAFHYLTKFIVPIKNKVMEKNKQQVA
jgi:hypothetical protein